jgi:hypothetical protein
MSPCLQSSIHLKINGGRVFYKCFIAIVPLQAPLTAERIIKRFPCDPFPDCSIELKSARERLSFAARGRGAVFLIIPIFGAFGPTHDKGDSTIDMKTPFPYFSGNESAFIKAFLSANKNRLNLISTH